MSELSLTASLRHELLQEVAEQLGYAVADMLAENWGGQTISFPKDHSFKLATRDLKIYNDWATQSMQPPALARKYKLSVQAIYNILKRVRKQAVGLRQGKLNL